MQDKWKTKMLVNINALWWKEIEQNEWVDVKIKDKWEDKCQINTNRLRLMRWGK